MKRTKKGKIITGVVIGMAAISLSAIGFSSWIIGVQDTTEPVSVTTVTVDTTSNQYVEMSMVPVATDTDQDLSLHIAEDQSENVNQTSLTGYGDQGADWVTYVQTKNTDGTKDFTISFQLSFLFGTGADPYGGAASAGALVDKSYSKITIELPIVSGGANDHLIGTDNSTGFHGADAGTDVALKYVKMGDYRTNRTEVSPGNNVTSITDNRFTFTLSTTDRVVGAQENDVPVGFVRYIETITIDFDWAEYFTYNTTTSNGVAKGPIAFYNHKMNERTPKDDTVAQLNNIDTELKAMHEAVDGQTITLNAKIEQNTNQTA